MFEPKVTATFFAACLAMGAWWLQNQWDEVQRTQDHIADRVTREELRYAVDSITGRLERIEDLIRNGSD